MLQTLFSTQGWVPVHKWAREGRSEEGDDPAPCSSIWLQEDWLEHPGPGVTRGCVPCDGHCHHRLHLCHDHVTGGAWDHRPDQGGTERVNIVSKIFLETHEMCKMQNIFSSPGRGLYRSDWVVVTRLYRGPMLLILMIFMLGLNVRWVN